MVITVNIDSFETLRKYVEEHELFKEDDIEENYIKNALQDNELSKSYFDFKDDEYFKVPNKDVMNGLSTLEDGIYELSGNFLEAAADLLSETENGRKPTNKEIQAARILFKVNQDLEKLSSDVRKYVRKGLDDAFYNVEELLEED